MHLNVSEVQPDDFMKFGGEKPSHLLIEEALISIGGTTFKKEALQLAGWNGGKLTTYASRAELAATAFNKIRDILTESDSEDEIKSALQNQS